MSAEVLREASRLMRERAEAATPGPWDAVAGAWGLPSDGPDHMRVVVAPHRNASDAVARAEYDAQGGADAEHIASWPPAVALAVAGWLIQVATARESIDAIDKLKGKGEPLGQGSDMFLAQERHALVVARAYLGETS